MNEDFFVSRRAVINSYGLIIAGRRTGKTEALLKFLHDNEGYTYLAPNWSIMEYSKLKYSELYPKGPYRKFAIQEDTNYTGNYLYDEFFLFEKMPKLKDKDIAMGTPNFNVTFTAFPV